MGANWSKDVDQTLAAAKEQSRPIRRVSMRLLLEEPVLGWIPSHMKIRRLRSSSSESLSGESSH